MKWEEAVSHAGDDANRANGAEFLRSAEHVHERPVHAANRRTAETVPAGDGDEGDEGDGSAGDSTATIPGDGSAGDSIATILGDGSADDSTATIPGEDAGAALPVPGDGDVVAEEDAPFVHVDAHRANSRADIFARLVSGARTRYTHPRAL